jgi:hypothetical protein
MFGRAGSSNISSSRMSKAKKTHGAGSIPTNQEEMIVKVRPVVGCDRHACILSAKTDTLLPRKGMRQ